MPCLIRAQMMMSLEVGEHCMATRFAPPSLGASLLPRR